MSPSTWDWCDFGPTVWTTDVFCGRVDTSPGANDPLDDDDGGASLVA